MLWTAEPDIDLLAGPAVPVRAYLESITLTQFMGDIAYAYPGFSRAVLPDQPHTGLPSQWGLWPNVEIPLKEPLVGNQKSHLLNVTRSGRDVTAVVCAYTYTSAEEDKDGQFVVPGQWGNQRSPNPGISAYLVKMTAPEREPAHALPPQKGPASAPVDDVFDGWNITGVLKSFSLSEDEGGQEWPSFQADIASCVDTAPDPPERRRFLIDGQHPRSDFPTLPASPGWPSTTG